MSRWFWSTQIPSILYWRFSDFKTVLLPKVSATFFLYFNSSIFTNNVDHMWFPSIKWFLEKIIHKNPTIWTTLFSYKKFFTDKECIVLDPYFLKPKRTMNGWKRREMPNKKAVLFWEKDCFFVKHLSLFPAFVVSYNFNSFVVNTFW